MDSVFGVPPARIHQSDVTVMEQTTVDDIEHIRAIWPPFERTVGLRGRKMYAMIDTDLHTYMVCTPVRDDDRADELSLQLGTLPGGWYLRGRLIGDPPEVYDRIGVGMGSWKQPRLAIRPAHWWSTTAGTSRLTYGCRCCLALQRRGASRV
jgi:hypothetical protein